VTFDTQIIFDTDCVLCSGMVHFILHRERAPTIQFVSAWSAQGLEIAAAHGLSRANLNETFIVVENGKGYIKSEAGFIILRHLRAPWSWLVILRIVPRFIRDALYTVIARRRYRWFGHREQCFLPPPGMAGRFGGY
jgi:predicted DCC family thiol-disulfide oxidoreductase YuxK